MPRDAVFVLGCFVGAYLVGSIPFAYIIVKAVTGEDVTEHGTGNVGAMNVRRSTGSWTWFAVAMVADALKGFVPVLAVKLLGPLPPSAPTADTLLTSDGAHRLRRHGGGRGRRARPQLLGVDGADQETLQRARARDLPPAAARCSPTTGATSSLWSSSD